MTKLLNTEDLMFGHKGILWRLMSKVALWLFGARKANEAYEMVMTKTDKSLEAINRVAIQVSPQYDPKCLANIPGQ